MDTRLYRRGIETLETALHLHNQAAAGSVEQEVYRNAVVKGFELTLETSAKLIRRALRVTGIGARSLDSLPFKDVFRQAAGHGLLEISEVERWFVYRDNRNSTAHDYGIGFAEETLGLVGDFIVDARRLVDSLDRLFAQGDGGTMPALPVDRLELPERMLRMVLDVLERCVPGSEVWAYGSRVNGGCHDASDLDLVVRRGRGNARGEMSLGAVREAFSESNIPIRVDVHDWDWLPEHFRDEIERGYVVLPVGVGAGNSPTQVG